MEQENKQENRFEETMIEGRNAVLEAFRSGKTVDKLFVLDGCQDGPVKTITREAKKQNTIIHYVAKERLDQLSETGKHQGVIAQAAAYRYAEVEDMLKLAEEKGEPPFLFILDGIEDPHNLGAIIRTANLAGAHGVIIPKRRAVGLTSTVAKTSAGALNYTPVAKVTNISTTAAAKETTKASETSYSGTIEANPSESKAAETKAAAKETTKAAETKAPTTAAATKATTASGVGPGGGPGTGGTSSSGNEVTNATRSAVVAYAKQFLGNPYVYGGTSLTNGADCSGFTMSVFAHFGISTGRSSRDQAAKGKEVAVSAVQPGDLLFYASGNYINHVALYIGNGQVIHASTAKSGIKISPSNYRTPCKAVSFLN